MAALALLLERVLSVVLQLLGLASSIVGFTKQSAQEHEPYAIETIAANAANTVNSPTFGNAQLLAAINALSFDLAAAQAAILTALGDPQQATTPVVLPTTPPAGYGGLTSDGTFEAVWFGLSPPDNVQPYTWIRALGSKQSFENSFSALYPADENYDWYFPAYDVYGAGPISEPVWDSSLIEADDTLLTFVTRINPTFNVGYQNGPGGVLRVQSVDGASAGDFLTRMREKDFDAMRNSLFPVVTSPIPPVWPGLANVTLGDPVTITPLTTVTAPMEGVIVNITDVTTNKPAIPYGDKSAWRYLGAIAFVSDNGDVEPWQQLAFADALYCPQSMTRAAGIVIRADAGVVGTVTPWVID